MRNEQEISEWLVAYMAKLLDIVPEEVDASLPFSEYGMDSTAAAGLTGDLSKWLGTKLKDSVAFDYPTIERLTTYLARSQASR